MQTRKKGLALLLALLMVFSLLPVSALAADGCLTTTSAGKAFSTKQGELLTVGLAQYFTDSEAHTLTYSLDAGDYGSLTKIAKDDDGNDVLSFTNPNAGDFTPTVTAKCSDGETASVKLSITVTESAKGDESQYGYDETPANSVTVYVTVSSDGIPIKGNDGTVISHLEVNVPYFDLQAQNLTDFYRYHTENGQGSYVDDNVVCRPTLLHLYLYLLGVYYLGLAPEEVTTGTTQINGHAGSKGVYNMNGDIAYDDSSAALNITGSAMSLYMQQFWGNDENLMYYRNHVYPLMSAGWGATADYILLSEGDTVDLAMFSNWSFWQNGAFAAFEQDSFTVAKGNTLTAHTLKYDTQSVADGGTEDFEPITGLTVAVYDADWKYVKDMKSSGEDENGYTYTFDKAGTYYLLALDPNAGEQGSDSAACYAPATAKVVVEEGSADLCSHTETETVFAPHDPKDGKFDETVVCKVCSETVSTTEHCYGDVNGDGTFKAGEFQVLIPYVQQGGTLPTEWQKFACDVNSDGKIDDDDIALISAIGRNANIVLPTSTERAYVYYKLDNGTEKHYVTITLPEYPEADLGGVYRLNEACTDANDDGQCDLCLHCTHTKTEVRNAKAATCGTEGYTGDTVCTVCEEIVTAGTAIPATGEHTDADNDGKCDVCGYAMIVLPTLKEGYPAETSATVQVGMAYVLSDLQANKVFDPVDGQTLSYKNYYYERSTDGGKTWSAKETFPEAAFGSLSIQLTETEVGTYIYRFYASHDGEHFSTDTWTLTLSVEEEPTLNFSFYVGKDYTGGYPIIKLYEVEKDAEGNEILGDEIKDVFLYSDFTSTLPEGEDEYDPAQGKLVSNYQMFYASLTAGRYAYRAFAKNADTGEYDVALGGMTLNLPTDKNVDGGAGGGESIYLQCNSFYVTTKKADNTYFTADEYHVRLDCLIMDTSAEMGKPYVNGNYTYYPTVLYAAGNACLYNAYAYPDIEGYMFTQSINLTYQPSYSAAKKNLSFNPAIILTATVPQNATFGLYFQWNNFNTTEVEPNTTWKLNDDGTKTAEYAVSKGNSNYTWRLSDSAHVTQAGWLASQSANVEMTFSFAANAATNRVSHDFSQLGTQTVNRDEADLQVNLDPSGFEAITGTTRVRAYRHWELINSDAGNIMVEPDFHWNVESGDAEIETVNGGNTTANWADVTPGTQDSVITVYYDSIDVEPSNHGSHGGLFPATQPQRVGVIVVGGTGVTHGSADADVDFNIAPNTTTTRSMDWDYNYDTWFYGANETDPALSFAVTATGDVTVEYAFVAVNNAMQRTVTNFVSVSAGEDGRYTVPLAKFGEIGNGMGGTVIIKMTDDTGVSYRLVRVAKVTITAENVSHPEEDIMPGDQVKLTFSGMFRCVDKFSGIFNPMALKPTYYDGTTSFTNTLSQYQKMDNASVTVTIPADLEFAEDAETTTYSFTNGYTFGSMFSAANPFATIYGMTDTGVGTNFNAVIVKYYVGHYADAAVTVHRKVTYDTQIVVPDASGNAIEGVTVILTGADGAVIEPDKETGRYTLGYGDYSYILSKDGYAKAVGKFSLGSADADKVGEDGILTVTGKALLTLGANAWDGAAKTEPKTDDNGVYQIGTAAELAWFADAVNGGQLTISAELTADIELGSFDWTPIGSSSAKYGGTFDGCGHIVRNIYINSTAMYQALFGYLSGTAKITDLGVTGIVVTTNGFASGIAGYMENNSVIDGCFNAADVTAAKSVSGIGNGQSAKALIQNSYNAGTITATGTNGLAGGITSGNGTSYTAGITNCYNIGTVIAVNSCGPLTPRFTNYNGEVTNCYYLEGSCNYALTKLGTAKTAEELKTSTLVLRLGTSFAADSNGINGGFPVLAWQGGTQPVPVEGDVNLDGKVEAADAELVYNYSLGSGTLTEVQLKIADMDGDGYITAKDAAMIYAIIAAAVTE